MVDEPVEDLEPLRFRSVCLSRIESARTEAGARDQSEALWKRKLTDINKTLALKYAFNSILFA